MNRILTFTLSALMLSAPALAQTAPEQKINKDKPNGSGEPGAISCYRPPSSYSRIDRLDCRPNADWARVHTDDNRNSALDMGNRAGGATVNVEPH